MTDPIHLLKDAQTIAVVGCSATPGKEAHDIPRALVPHYDVYPVNPSATEIFGKRVYRSLAELPGPVDIVNVFRPSAEAPQVAQAAVDAGARALWLQTGIANPEARRIAEEAGLAYVENTCIRVALGYVLAQRAGGLG